MCIYVWRLLIIQKMLRQLFNLKPQKPLPLGRWTTQTTMNEMERRADLANCDSCGTCSVPENYIQKTSKFVVQDDIIDVGDLICVGSFHLSSVRK